MATAEQLNQAIGLIQGNHLAAPKTLLLNAKNVGGRVSLEKIPSFCPHLRHRPARPVR